MNKADSERLTNGVMQLGYKSVKRAEDADIIVLNSCVVRGSAEDKVLRKLSNLKALKRKRPHVTLVLTGCMVDSNIDSLKTGFPHVDFFLKPQQFSELLEYARSNYSKQGHSPEPLPSCSTPPGAFIPVIQGCNNFCSYCIVPYRRGREKSRNPEEILCEIRSFVQAGGKEVTLLGQNVDSYGHDLPDGPDLADLLQAISTIDGLARIRFLTSHPKDMSQKLIEAVASLKKVCEHISLPAQAGDNEILRAMRRGYTIEQYRELIQRIRSAIPDVALSTDIIVGFPGEDLAQFERTVSLLEELRFDTVHSAAYSPRPNTIAARKFTDNIPDDEKKRRLRQIEALQERISAEKNALLVGQRVEVLVEGKRAGKWQGRTRTDKLVFFTGHNDYQGQLVQVGINHAGTWSLQGKPVFT